MKIKEIKDEAIVFDNGSILQSFHPQDCCESHWLDFSVLKENKYVSVVDGKKFNIYDREFDFSDGVTFKPIEGMGILLHDTYGDKYLINGYGENNGYYGTDIFLQYYMSEEDEKDWKTDPLFEYNVSDCQKPAYEYDGYWDDEDEEE